MTQPSASAQNRARARGSLASTTTWTRRVATSCTPGNGAESASIRSLSPARWPGWLGLGGGGATVSFKVEVRNVDGAVTALGAAGPFTLVVDSPAEAGGGGRGFNGGQPATSTGIS